MEQENRVLQTGDGAWTPQSGCDSLRPSFPRHKRYFWLMNAHSLNQVSNKEPFFVFPETVVGIIDIS